MTSNTNDSHQSPPSQHTVSNEKPSESVNLCQGWKNHGFGRFTNFTNILSLPNLHRVQKKSNIFIFTIYFSQFLDNFYETFSEYP